MARRRTDECGEGISTVYLVARNKTGHTPTYHTDDECRVCSGERRTGCIDGHLSTRDLLSESNPEDFGLSPLDK